MRRVLVGLFTIAALWAASPADAIETATFGMEPHPNTKRTSFHIELQPGGKTDDALRVWNKTDRQLTLKLAAISASVDDAGKVALGGSSGTASWFAFEPAEVQLAPKASQVVRFTVRAPDSLDGTDVAAAITVEPVRTGGSGVAVVQRLATMVYVKTVAGAVSGGIDWKLPVLIVLSVVSIVGAVLTWTRPRNHRPEDGSEAFEDEEEEEDDMNAHDAAEVEVGPILVDVHDPGVDRLLDAMYAPPQQRVGQPALELIVCEPDAQATTPTPAPSEEFAWAVVPRR